MRLVLAPLYFKNQTWRNGKRFWLPPESLKNVEVYRFDSDSLGKT